MTNDELQLLVSVFCAAAWGCGDGERQAERAGDNDEMVISATDDEPVDHSIEALEPHSMNPRTLYDAYDGTYDFYYYDTAGEASGSMSEAGSLTVRVDAFDRFWLDMGYYESCELEIDSATMAVVPSKCSHTVDSGYSFDAVLLSGTVETNADDITVRVEMDMVFFDDDGAAHAEQRMEVGFLGHAVGDAFL